MTIQTVFIALYCTHCRLGYS